MNREKIGAILELCGALAVLVGAIAGAHHLLFSLPVSLGFLALYVGRKMRAGSL
jgi:hypothetical protein